MKVLHLSSEKSWRGGEQQIAYLIDELTNLGVHNFVACKKNSAFEQYCIEKSIPFIALNFSGSFDFNTAIRIKQFSTINNINIIHMNSGNSHSIGVISSLLGNKSKFVLSRRVDFPVKNNWLSKYKFNYSKIDKIICVSEAIKAMILPSIKEKNKVTVIHSGFDFGRFKESINTQILHKEFRLDKDVKIVANVSALAPHKDYITFINAAKHFLSKGGKAKFFIIGDGPSKKEIENYIRQNKLVQYFILTGFRTDIENILPEIDVFLITSKTEGLGTTILDAMANKVPVVATAGGGIPEMVKHEITGLLYKTMDYEGLAEGVARILNDERLKKEIVNNAFHLVTNHFSKTLTAEKTEKVYQDILVN